MISLPYLAETAPALRYLGGYLALQDLSTLRVLQLGDVSARGNASVVEIVNGEDPKWCARPCIIIMIVLLIVVGISPSVDQDPARVQQARRKRKEMG